MEDLITIQRALNEIKEMFEDAILKDGRKGQTSLIRSSKPINLIHDVVKSELIKKGVEGKRIHPKLGESRGEIEVAGFFKKKKQDILVVPNNVKPKREVLDSDGILEGYVDNYGRELTEHSLSINIRSQLSSMAKNFDTLYERTFAEALNLHLRCPKMVCGEVYMIAVKAYDDKMANTKKIGFLEETNLHNHIEKYIKSFEAINKRSSTKGEEYRYEEIALLIVDFSFDEPKIYSSDNELKADSLLPANSRVSMQNLSINNFADRILKTYEKRFGKDRFS